MRAIKAGVLYQFKKEEIPGEVSDPNKYKFCYCEENWQPGFIMADM